MLRFIKSLQFLYKPKYWLKQHPYCPRLDRKINKLLDDGVLFVNIGWYAADLGDLKDIWISGYPFSFGNLWEVYDYQPSRTTIKRMRKVLLKQIESNYEKRNK
jgi:hypothetical protein